jgi:hypothetical protein
MGSFFWILYLGVPYPLPFLHFPQSHLNPFYSVRHQSGLSIFYGVRHHNGLSIKEKKFFLQKRFHWDYNMNKSIY